MRKGSKLIEARLPCPSCPSSDGYHLYDDGHGYCFSCEYFKPANKGSEDTLNTFTYEYLPQRGISSETFKRYGVKTKIDAEGKPNAIGFQYPSGHHKVRYLSEKRFEWVKPAGKEDAPNEPGLFGRDKFSSGEHKYVTITEGEYDALSLYQVLGSPVVSVQSASSAARDVAADRSWLNSYERIYLAFDGDQPGREAAAKVAKLFDFNKVYQVKFDKHKDANEYLKAGEETELRQIWWNARRYQPENVVSTFKEFSQILSEVPKAGVPYPFKSWNDKTYGIRTGESVLLTAQEGVGKTEVMHAIEYQLLKETNHAVGAIFLEEPKRRHLQAIAGLELRQPVHLPDCFVDQATTLTALQAVVGPTDRLHVYSHFGSDDPDTLLDTIRFMVVALECRYILLDHVTMVVSGLAGEDERRALDYFSTRLEMMVKELDFALIMVSHVNDDGRTRGSRYISKVADIRIDISRDTGNPDPIARNTTEVSISKNRFSGKTGPVSPLLFDPVTYTYSEIGNVWDTESTIPISPANDNVPAKGDGRRAA